MRTLKITGLRGRLYDEAARCNKSANPLRAEVEVLRPGEQWRVKFTLTEPSSAHVLVIVDYRDVALAQSESSFFESVPLPASGHLFADFTDYVVDPNDKHGAVLFGFDKNPLRRASVVLSGPFTGARLLSDSILRVDCHHLLSMFIECGIALHVVSE